MDEVEYRDLYHNVNQRRCIFEKAILTRRFGCSKLVKINIADREAAACSEGLAQKNCQELLSLFRKNATFAIHTTGSKQPLPHAKEIKVQCGGLTGLAHTLSPEDEIPDGVADIHACIELAKHTFSSLDDFPFNDIVKVISHYEGRKKRKT